MSQESNTYLNNVGSETNSTTFSKNPESEAEENTFSGRINSEQDLSVNSFLENRKPEATLITIVQNLDSDFENNYEDNEDYDQEQDANTTLNYSDSDVEADTETEANSKFIIKYSPSFGRYLVATKNIESYELLIDEKPVVVAPSGEYDIHPITQRPLPICIGCLKSQNPPKNQECESQSKSQPKQNQSMDLDNRKFQKCPSCSWPICEEKCVGIDNFHTTEECGLFRSKGIIQSPRSLRMVYLIRCCLMAQTNPKNWQKLLQLGSTAKITTATNEENHDLQLNPFLEQDEQDYRFLIDVCGFDGEKLPKSLVFRINGVRRVNGFGFYNTELDSIRFYGMALYFMASMASHGCSPNMTTQVVYDPRESFPMRFRTKTEIKRGQLLKIAYRSHWLELGTLRRREKIFQDHKFLCQCDRCSDPTENGTYFSAIKCEICLNGYLFPEEPLNVESLWKCDNSFDNQCENVKTEQEITDILEPITDDIENILRINDIENNDKDKDLLDLDLDMDISIDTDLDSNLNKEIDSQRKFNQLSLMLSGSAKNTLHENHYLIMRTEVEWIRHFPFDILQKHEQKQQLGDTLTDDEQIEIEIENLRKIWNLFTLLLERGEHCKLIYSKLIPDWAEKNYFIDLAIGRAYQMYYLEQAMSIWKNCESQKTQKTQNIQNYSNSNFHPDLLLDLLKINLKYFQTGLRFEDPFSNLAYMVKSNCKIIQANITHLLSACD